MSEKALQVGSSSFGQSIKQGLLAVGASHDIAVLTAGLAMIQCERARLLEARSPRYVALPERIGILAADPRYAMALPHGRLAYRDEQYEVDLETETLTRCPCAYTRQELGELVEM